MKKCKQKCVAMILHKRFSNSRTPIIQTKTSAESKDQIKASRAKAAAGMKELHDLPSRDKRAYKLKHFNLSELVSDLWWLDKKHVDRKALTAGK